MSLPIYELKISQNMSDEAEVDFIALVDEPAIKKDFIAFKDEFIEPSKGEHETDFIPRCISYVVSEGKDQDQATAICYSIWEQHFSDDKVGDTFEETYSDYPKEASENAQIALDYAEKNGWGECGEATGKKRASMLANRENLSRDTIARMASFERHRQYSQKELGDGCGRLMWLAWGGDAGIEWASRKLAQIDREKFAFKIMNEEKRIISGAMMIADELIYRNNKMGEHYVKFSAETIKQIAIKFAKKKYNNRVNLMHDPEQKVKGVTMFESWLVDKERGIMPMKGFEGVADGSWFASFYVENDDVWNAIKRGEYRGFSVEGLFEYDQPMTAEENALKKIQDLLSLKITN